MQLLLRLLSRNDALAKEALEVLRIFEVHQQSQSDLLEVIESATRLLECRVTVRGSDGRMVAAAHSDGWPRKGGPLFSIRQDFGPTQRPLGTVCIDTSNPAGIIERCILDCAAHTAELTLLREQLPTGGASLKEASERRRITTKSLVGTMLRAETAVSDRLRALRLLDLPDSGRLRVAAFDNKLPAREMTQAVAAVAGPGPVVSTFSGRVIAIAQETTCPLPRVAWPTEFRVGLGEAVPAEYLPRSLDQAQKALMFTHRLTALSRVANWDDLGTFSALSTVPVVELENSADVRVLLNLGRTNGGLKDIALLEGLCLAGTIRSTATLLHLHHSSVARRMSRLEERFGFSPTEPSYRGRLQVAIFGWRLLVSGKAPSIPGTSIASISA